MTTVLDWITETKDHLAGPFMPVLDELGAGMDATQDTVTLSYTDRLIPGTVLSINGEDTVVRTWEPSSHSAIVRRGWRGTVAAAHAIGDEVEVNPRFTNGQIMRRLLQEVRSWPSQLFRIEVTTLDTLSSYATFADWATPLRTLLMVQVRTGENDLAWHGLPHARLRALGETSRVEFGAFIGPAQSVEVHVGVDFDLDVWTVETDVVTEVGLAPSMTDIAPLGAALRLIGFSEMQRTDRSAQGEPRWAEESPAGHASQTVQSLWRFRNQRIADEIGRLRSVYPMMG